MAEQASSQTIYIVALTIVFLSLCKLVMDKYWPTFDHIPTVGYSGRFTSYISAYQFFKRGREIYQEGYDKHPTGLFKVPTMDMWQFVVGGGELAEDLKKAGLEELNFFKGAIDIMRFDYTIKANVTKSAYHLKVLRAKLGLFKLHCDEVYEECVVALDLIGATENEWTSVPVWETARQIVARTCNRIFVGLPLCRNPEYLDLCIGFGENVMRTASLINLTPKFLHPIVGPLLSPYKSLRRQSLKHLGPVISERLGMIKGHESDLEGTPDDLISWYINEAQGEDAKIENLAMRILLTNFAAVHGGSLLLTQALLDLAARPEYIAPLRQEAREITESEGWSNSAIAKLYKLDSFVRESARLSGLAAISMFRKVCDPNGFRFSNGVTLPYGSCVALISDAMHHDASFYPDSYIFDGYRSYNLGKADLERGDESQYYVKYALTSLSTNWAPWGLGKGACPGRFLAAHIAKSAIACVLLHYDIKLEGEERPESTWIGNSCLPGDEGRLLFRKRC